MVARHGGGRWSRAGAWLAAGAAAWLLLVGLLLLPRAWIASFFCPLQLRPAPASRPAPVLRILAPPTVVLEAPGESRRARTPAPPPTAPDWWEEGWRRRLLAGAVPLVAPAPAPPPPGLPELTARIRVADLLAEPDTALARRLELLRRGDRREFERVRGLLAATVHARRLQAILEQAARVHGEFSEGEVEATPLPPEPEPPRPDRPRGR